MRNVALMGPSGAGKTTVARILETRAGYQPCKSGAICRQISSILFGDESRHNLNVLTDALKTISEDILISAALRHARPDLPILIDSLRYQSDFDFATKENFFIVRVTAEPSKCIDRLNQRGQTFNQFEDLNHASETTLRDHPYDYGLSNDGDLDDLGQAVDRLLQTIRTISNG